MSSRGGYSGSTTIKFTVERVKDPVTGQLRPFNEGDSDDIEVQAIELSIEGESYFSPGVNWRKPEDCYPDESETRINKISSPDSKVWVESDFTKEEYQGILEAIQASVQSDSDYGPDEDYFDGY